MHNRVRDIALKVLKEHEHRIFVTQTGSNRAASFILTVRGLKAGSEAYDETESALRAIFTDYCQIKPSGDHDVLMMTTNSKNGATNLTAGVGVENDAVGRFARELVDAGINFHGSARFKSCAVGV